jgi:hypothetical protein
MEGVEALHTRRHEYFGLTMSRIAINPGASPVDTFMAPEVRAEPSNASGLADLARSLQGFNSSLVNYTDRVFAEQRKEAAVSAQAEVQRLKIKNMKELKAATDRGDIRPGDNPYFMQFAEQLTAREEARQLTLSVATEIESDPTLRGGEVPQVQEYIDKRYSQMVEGRSSSELEAILPLLDDSRSKYLANHAARRAGARERDASEGLRREASQVSNMVRDARASGGVVDYSEEGEIRGSLQTAVVNAVQAGMRVEDVSDQLLAGLAQAATAAEDPELVRRLAPVLLIEDGKSLQDVRGPDIERVVEDLEEVSARKESSEYARQVKQDNAVFDEFSADLLSKLDTFRASNPGKPVTLADLSVSVQDLPASVQVNASNLINMLVQRSNREEVGKVYSSAVRSLLDEDPSNNNQSISAQDALLLFGEDGVQAVERIVQLRNRPGETDPKAMGDYYDLRASGASRQQLQTFLMDTAESKRLSPTHLSILMEDAGRPRANSFRDDEASLVVKNFVSELRRRALADQANLAMSPEGQMVLRPDVEETLDQQSFSYYREMVRISQRPPEQQAPLWDAFISRVDNETSKLRVELESSRLVDAARGSLLAQDTATRRAGLKFNNGSFVTAGGQEVPSDVPLFDGIDDIRRNFGRFVLSSGIPVDSEQAARLVMRDSGQGKEQDALLVRLLHWKGPEARDYARDAARFYTGLENDIRKNLKDNERIADRRLIDFGATSRQYLEMVAAIDRDEAALKRVVAEREQVLLNGEKGRAFDNRARLWGQ